MVSSKFSRAMIATALAASTASAVCTFEWPAQSGDTCQTMADEWSITLAQFISYNPSVGPNCQNLVVGTSYCVEEDYGQAPSSTSAASTVQVTATSTTLKTTTKPPTSSSASSTAATTTTTTSTRPAGPSPTQDGLVSTCQNFYKVASGDTCQKIVDQYGTFTLDQFYSWNPAVGTDCSGLWVGYYVCVGIPGTPTTKPATTSTAAPTGPSPTQSGLVSNCQNYYKVATGDTCDKIVAKYGTFTTSQFVSWNPAVGSDCTGLWVDYYVCVGVPSTPTTRPPATSTTAAPTGPTPTQTGIISNCNNWYKVASGDSCDKISSNYGTFTTAQFISWNPAVGSDCTSLWVGYYVCVGVPGTPTTRPASTTTAKATGPSPTQTGITSSCKKYYQAQSGDYCQKIADNNQITLANFYSWNPAVGTSCASLWVGYYYCVGV
ncbi:peptidoglycan-binding lysin subgroup [Diplogelasinospora grovesii]|uniref:Peptidoglycan-binding lysin subgroup n=1 Tax=Diplogelasinospora grovesii TaxID=303347 RepID=A0AAN6S957_9PEZI|nr:peptidoglycan-binding lysin subgroup [Diplogelasinospora grovesii]